MIQYRTMKLTDFFKKNSKVAVALSGGVDSAYLLYAAVNAGADVKAYYVKSALQPDFETRDAKELAGKLGCSLEVIETDVLADPLVAANPPDRCYHCKKHIMSAIIEAAEADGYEMVCDGTNASDDASDRPGYRALRELGISSPLRDCGLTKKDIRRLSEEAVLPAWNKPVYACLATRIRTGEPITPEKLAVTEKAEGILFDMGYRDFRVRMRGDSALVQIAVDQFDDAMSRADEIIAALSGLYEKVSIDDVPRPRKD